MWDSVRYGTNDFLGEVILELNNHPLDDEAEWYILQQHENSPNHTVSYKIYTQKITVLLYYFLLLKHKRLNI